MITALKHVPGNHRNIVVNTLIGLSVLKVIVKDLPFYGAAKIQDQEGHGGRMYYYNRATTANIG